MSDEDAAEEITSLGTTASESLHKIFTELSNMPDKESALRRARQIDTFLGSFSQNATDASGQSEGSEFSVDGGEQR